MFGIDCGNTFFFKVKEKHEALLLMGAVILSVENAPILIRF